MSVAAQPTSIITRMTLSARPSDVWQSLVFFEQIAERAPLLLRLVLPRPIGTQGAKSAVGDQATCLYEGGHLLKRVTQIERDHVLAFSVIEQQLTVGRRVVLTGGCYTLRELPGEKTELAVTTRYFSHNGPRWLLKPIETFVCHMFHRHLLAAIRRKTYSSARLTQRQDGLDAPRLES